MELFLEQHVDADCCIIVWNSVSAYTSAYAVSLEELIRQINPDNYGRLQQLLAQGPKTFHASDYRKIESELKDMGDPELSVQPFDLKFTREPTTMHNCDVHRIQWVDSVVPGRFQIQFY